MLENDSIINIEDDWEPIPTESEVVQPTQLDENVGTTTSNVTDSVTTNEVTEQKVDSSSNKVLSRTEITKILKQYEVQKPKYDISKFADSVPFKYNTIAESKYDHLFPEQFLPKYPKPTKIENLDNVETEIVESQIDTSICTQKKESTNDTIEFANYETTKVNETESVVESEQSTNTVVFHFDCNYREYIQLPYSIEQISDSKQMPLLSDLPNRVQKEVSQVASIDEVDTITKKDSSELTIAKSEEPKPVEAEIVESSKIEEQIVEKPKQIEKVKIDLTAYNPKTFNYQDCLVVEIQSTHSYQTIETHRKQQTLLNNETKSDESAPSWMLWYLIIGFILFVWIKLAFRKYIDTALEACFNSNNASKMFLSKNNYMMQCSFVANILFFMMMGLFIYQILYVFGYVDKTNGLYRTIDFSLLVALIYIAKTIICKVLGAMLDYARIASEYNFTVYLYNKLYGVILLAITTSVVYLKSEFITPKTIIYIGVALWFITYLMRLVRGAVISLRRNVSIFYLILYLCGLEIGPLFILYKIFSMWQIKG